MKEKLNNIRVNKGLTQLQLAEKVGAAQATINKLESGQIKNPSFELAVKIANVLETNVFDIFGNDTNHNLSSSDNKTDELKLSFLSAIKKYESTKIFLKSDVLEKEKLDEYKRLLDEFTTGIVQQLINDGVLSKEDIMAFRKIINE